MVIIEDLPGVDFGELGRVWFGNERGLKPYLRSDLGAEAQGVVGRLLDALRRDGLTAMAYQSAAAHKVRSREHFDRVSKLERAARKAAASRRELGQAAADLAERHAASATEPVVSLGDALIAPVHAEAPKPPSSGPSPSPKPAHGQAPVLPKSKKSSSEVLSGP